MRKKQLIALIICFSTLLGIIFPGTLAWADIEKNKADSASVIEEEELDTEKPRVLAEDKDENGVILEKIYGKIFQASSQAELKVVLSQLETKEKEILLEQASLYDHNRTEQTEKEDQKLRNSAELLENIFNFSTIEEIEKIFSGIGEEELNSLLEDLSEKEETQESATEASAEKKKEVGLEEEQKDIEKINDSKETSLELSENPEDLLEKPIENDSLGTPQTVSQAGVSSSSADEGSLTVYNPYGSKSNEENYQLQDNLWHKLEGGSYKKVSVSKKKINKTEEVYREVKRGDENRLFPDLYPANRYYWQQEHRDRLYYKPNLKEKKYTRLFIEKTSPLLPDTLSLYSYYYKKNDKKIYIDIENSSYFFTPWFPEEGPNRIWPIYIREDKEVSIYEYIYTYQDDDGKIVIASSEEEDTNFNIEFYAQSIEGVSARKDAKANGDGTFDIVMETWKTSNQEFVMLPYDIVLVLDQSRASHGRRNEILKNAREFIEKLNTEFTPVSPRGLKATNGDHRVAIVGYGRIEHSGESDPQEGFQGQVIASNNYNTGFYNKDGSFITDETQHGLEWQEVTDPASTSLPQLFDNKGELAPEKYNDIFMTPDQAINVLTNDNIAKWNAGAARLDAGLTLTNEILTKVKPQANQERKELVLVFSHSQAVFDNGNDNYVNRVQSIETATTTLKNRNTTMLSIGDLCSLQGSGDPEQYNQQMNLMTLDKGNPVSNPQEKGYRFSLRKMAELTKKMNEIIVPNIAIVMLQDLISQAFEVIDKSTEIYIVPFKGQYDDSGEPIFDEELKISCKPEDGEDCPLIKGDIAQGIIKVGELALAPIVKQEGDRLADYASSGHKLQVITTVKAKDEFIGGNKVPTNLEGSGVYDATNQEKLITAFPYPRVDVEIKDFKINTNDINVYLGKTIEKTAIKDKASMIFFKNEGKQEKELIELDLSKEAENFGLKDWQNKYVELTTNWLDAITNNPITRISNITEDHQYKFSVKVIPIEDGAVQTKEQSSNPTNISVFKPSIKYDNGQLYYGDTIMTIGQAKISSLETPPAGQTSLQDYLAGVETTLEWYHNNDLLDNKTTTIFGEKPELSFQYLDRDYLEDNLDDPDHNKYNITDTIITDEKFNLKRDRDVVVKVTAKHIGQDDVDISDYVMFNHEDADFDSSDKQFIIDALTTSLKISKEGGAENEPYLFEIYKADIDSDKFAKYTEVTIVGTTSDLDSLTISELPVSKYKIVENTAWNWRYESSQSEKYLELNSNQNSGEIVISNKEQINTNWLSKFSDLVINIFGVSPENKEGGN